MGGNGQYEDKDPKFRADSGFMPRVDVRSLDATVDRRFWGKKGDWHQLITVGFVGNKVENHNGDATDQHLEANASFFGSRQSQLQLKVQNIEELYAGVNYEQDRISLFGEIKLSGDLVFNFITRDGDAIDYNNGRPGEQFLLNPGVQWRVGRHFNSTFDYLIQNLDVEGGELFNAQLFQTQLVYQFNARSFIRGIFQYQEITRDPDLYFYSVDEKSQTLFTQLLFSYKINPRTVLFAGYTDNRAGYEFDRTRVDLTQLDRTFFLKVGYAFLR